VENYENPARITGVPVNGTSLDYKSVDLYSDRLCGLVVRVLGYRSGGPGSIPGTTKKK
jgi:hypothetical protein